MKRITHQHSAGFTIVELAIIVPILIVSVLVLFESMFYLVRVAAINRTQTALIYENQNALNIIEADAVLTTTFLPTTDTNVTDVYKPTSNAGQWSYLGDTQDSATRVLILRAFNTTTNPLSADRVPSFLSALGCDTDDIYSNDILQYNIIYFVKDGNLYRRRALDTSQATCETPYQKQSCPSLETLGLPTRDTSCAADDELIATDVTAFSVQYYQTKNSSTPMDVYNVLADPDTVSVAAAVDVSLTLARDAYHQNTVYTSSIRIARLNAPVDIGAP